MVQSWQSLNILVNIPWKKNRLKPEFWWKHIYTQGTCHRTSWKKVEIKKITQLKEFSVSFSGQKCSVSIWFVLSTVGFSPFIYWLSAPYSMWIDAELKQESSVVPPWVMTQHRPMKHSNICGSVGTRTSMASVTPPPSRRPLDTSCRSGSDLKRSHLHGRTGACAQNKPQR